MEATNKKSLHFFKSASFFSVGMSGKNSNHFPADLKRLASTAA
jgi:hypothetical protein